MKPSKFFSNITALISIIAFVVAILSITTFVETATEFNTNCIDCTPLSSKEEMYLRVSKYNLIFSIIGLFTALLIRTNLKSTD